jgi:agmatine/peptidylarginine deiminase
MGSHIVKPIFKPRYYRKFFDEAAVIDSYSKILHSILGVDMEQIPLIWDGGNLVTNGEVGFITDQILQDNKKTHSEKEIKELISSCLGIEPVIVPSFSDDPFAHTDGYMNFLNKDTIALASYPKEWRRKEINYLKELKTKVKRHVKNVVELKENPVEEMNGSIYSAKGSYVNFLKLGKMILVPSFQDKETEKYNYGLLKPYGKVVPINCNELAKFGGLLHCISFTN